MTAININSNKAFNTQLGNLGSDSKRLAALAEFAAEQARQERYNLDPAMRLLAKLGVISHNNVKALDKRDIPKKARFVKGYLGEQARLTVKKGALERKDAELPAFESFEEYIARLDANKSETVKEYDGQKELEKTVKDMTKKRDKAEAEGDTIAASLYDKLRAETEAQLEEYKRQKSLAQRNAEQEEEVAV